MRIETCEFKQCCFCLPLRYGILVIGYLKLVISSAMLVAFLYLLEMESRMMDIELHNHLKMFFAIAGIICVFLLTDIAFAIVYLIGSHKKNVKLLKVFNYYAIGMLAFCVLVFLIFLGHQLILIKDDHGIFSSALIFRGLIFVAFVIGTLCFDVYTIFLNRSEILKLETHCNFRFGNNANEDQCTIEVGENRIN